FRSLTGETSENDLGGPFGLPPPGQLFLTATPRDLGAPRLGDLTVGLGLQNLFGFASRYPEDGPLRTAITSASLPPLDNNPSPAPAVPVRPPSPGPTVPPGDPARPRRAAPR